MVQRALGLSRPCLASTWRKVRAQGAVGGQSVPAGIPVTLGKGAPAGSRAGGRWSLLEECGHRMERKTSRTFPPASGAKELRLFLWRFCSRSPVCTEQGPALVHAPELWETQPRRISGAGSNGGPVSLPAPCLRCKRGRM